MSNANARWQRDAETALAALAEETSELEAAQERAGEDIAEAESRAAELNEALAETERLLERLTSELAERNARQASLERSRRLAAELGRNQRPAACRGRSPAGRRHGRRRRSARRAGRRSAAEEARALGAGRRGGRGRSARRLARRRSRPNCDARAPLEDAEREAQRLSAEAKALSDLLHPEGQGLWPPLVDAVTVQPGYEAALAAALGDDLQAPLDEAAPHHWRDLGVWTTRRRRCPKAPSRSPNSSRRRARWRGGWR